MIFNLLRVQNPVLFLAYALSKPRNFTVFSLACFSLLALRSGVMIQSNGS